MRAFSRGVVILGLLLVIAGFGVPTVAGTASKVAQETAEFVLRKFGKPAAKEGGETLGRRLEDLALRHGDDALLAARKTGPLGIKAMEEAGEHSDDVVKLLVRHGDEALWITAKPGRTAIFVRYGDDAAEAMVRHRQIAASLIEQFGAPGARAMTSLEGRNARRLAMMMEEGELRRLGRSEELLDVIARYGDRAMDFVWKHKGALAITTVLAAFLAEPEPFINGARDITTIAAENVAQPLAEVPVEVAQEAAHNVNWTVVFAVVTGLIVLLSAGGVAGVMRKVAALRSHISHPNGPTRPAEPLRTTPFASQEAYLPTGTTPSSGICRY